MTPPDFPQPLGGNEMPRFAGIATFMRLPGTTPPRELDVGVVGVPFDIGTSNRPGARFGPRGIRAESVLLRPYNMATRAAPFDSLRIDDLGDVATNPYNVPDSMDRIAAYYTSLLADGLITATMGGDHTIVLPILRAMAAKHGPVGLVHVDAHTDINDSMFGERVAHGTPFRRAVEEGLLEGRRVVQIGVRGTGYQANDFDWSRQQGFRVVQVEECWYRSLEPLMAEVRAQLGEGPVYLSFDIDGLDPSFAPGTGTPEIGGLTITQGMEIIRGCRGLQLVGCDVVEVAPIYDVSGMTSLVGANLLYEMLCVLPGVESRS
ncbi:MAG TPA: agmatinase [Ilumatobacteraceae bacterium]|nr:agmatinase [Ilumatobacteraceae bacterium]